MTLRAGLKAGLEQLLFQLGPERLGRVFRGSGALILTYHNVVEDEEVAAGDASLHLAWSSFARQLDLLVAMCEVVPLSEILTDRRESGERPRAALTFDDAYRGAVRLALPELRKRGLPATIFVAPGLLGDRTFWWDALLCCGKDSASLRRAALEEHSGRARAVREWAAREGLRWAESDSDRRSSTLEELRNAVGDGIRVASHGWSHASLARLTEAECRDELERSIAWLGERVPHFLPWLSYPYGAESPRVRALARATGYEAACLVSGGWLRHPVRERFSLPRLNVPAGLSLEGFAVRLAGLLCR